MLSMKVVHYLVNEMEIIFIEKKNLNVELLKQMYIDVMIDVYVNMNMPKSNKDLTHAIMEEFNV